MKMLRSLALLLALALPMPLLAADVGTWSTTAGNNNSASPDGFPEGMAPSGVNDSAREVMTSVREWYNLPEWVEYGDGDGAYTATYASATSFTIAGVDVTTQYHAGRRIRVVATTPGTIYGVITSSSFSTNTTVNIDWDGTQLSNEAITSVWLSAQTAMRNTSNSVPDGVKFLAYNSAEDADVTGNGTQAAVDFDTEVFDLHGDFASDTFTAPITGKYLLSTTVQQSDFGAGATNALLEIITTNRTYQYRIRGVPTSDVAESYSLTVVADMDASETAVVRITVAGMAGDTTDTDGGSTLVTWFSGALIGR